MKTIDIKGKAYVQVNDRILHFREHFPDHSLISDIVENENGRIIIKASVLNPEGREIATGYAYEMEGSTFINKTSYIENCETSAWGRALGNLGIGIDTSVASFEEVGNAVEQQKPKKISKKAQVFIDAVIAGITDSADSLGLVVVPEKLAALLYAQKNAYPEDIDKAPDTAKWIAEKHIKSVAKPAGVK